MNAGLPVRKSKLVILEDSEYQTLGKSRMGLDENFNLINLQTRQLLQTPTSKTDEVIRPDKVKSSSPLWRGTSASRSSLG